MENQNQSYAFEGRGKVYLTPVTGGTRGESFWVGVSDTAALSHSVDGGEDLYERHTGKDELWDTSDGTTTTSMSFNIKERRIDALTAALQAVVETVAAATVTGEAHTASNVGSIAFLKHQKVSNVVIEDSTTGTAQPLAEGVDYKVDADYGRIEMLTDGFVQPLNVGYDYGEVTIIKPMTSKVDHYEVRVEGLNKVGQKDKQLIEVYKFKPDPVDTLDVLNESFSELTLEGNCLYDASDDREASYRIVKL